VLQVCLLQLVLVALVSAAVILFRFYRDPERVPPEVADSILCPADGTIIYVKNVEKGEVPLSEKQGTKFRLSDLAGTKELPESGILVGIAMTFLDVHVNRAPITGTVTHLEHIRGLFRSLKHKEAVFQNERALLLVDNPQMRLGIILIASRLVRQIVAYVSPGDAIARGQRIGMIRFGSQVDVFLPHLPDLSITVTPGQKVCAGTSILATYRSSRETE
jgi:phosphatidylserine decarboxylase